MEQGDYDSVITETTILAAICEPIKQPKNRPKKENEAMKRFLLAANLFLLSTSVFAAGLSGMSQFEKLVQDACTWIQGIALLFATGGFVIAGMRFISGDHDAKEKVKNVVIGSACIAGAGIFVGVIKSYIH